MNALQIMVNHKDLDSGNNHVENLEYVTPTENMQHLHAALRRAGTRARNSKAVRAKHTAAPDAQWVHFESLTDAALALGMQPSGISHCLRGRQKRTHGYVFEYPEIREAFAYLLQ